MKRITLSLLTLLCAGFTLPAAASDLMVAATMQRCTTNEECALVTNSCKDNCGFVPVNKENMPALQSQYQTRCGKAMEANPTCNMNPPISAACVNSRCTIDYAYKNNAGAGDYQSGAYPVPEAPAPNKVQGDYTKIDDRKGGFTAYDLPQTEVKENTVGTLHTTVYVPPSAPVSGGNYVPVGTPPAAAPAPAAAIPPAAVPTNTTYATPPVVTTPPVAPVPTPPPAPVMAPPVAPTMVPPVAPLANVPAMTPSLPNQVVPTPPPAPVQAPAVPATPTAPYQYVAPETVVTAPPVPAPTPVPVAPPGSVPIPPSDLKPVPTFIPPAGGTIPVNPEDPGAPPPEGTKLMLKGTDMETDATKSFGASTKTKKTTRTYELN